MTTNRSFLPNDTAELFASSDNQRGTIQHQSDWRKELAEYNKYRDIDRLMRERHGVRM